MTNGQAVFIGGCLIVTGGIIAMPLGLLAGATNAVHGGAGEFAGTAAIVAGGILAMIGWYAMKLSVKNDV